MNDHGDVATLRLDGVSFSYRGDGANGYALRNVNLTLRQGETVAMMGHNGSGKTTLLRIAAGLLRPDAGSVHARFNGHEERLLAPLKEIGYIPQQLGLLRNRTVHRNVLLGCLGRVSRFRALAGFFPEGESARASEWIERVGLRHKEHEKVYRLSGGERQRVAIARSMMQRPKILLADEFVSSLDPVKARDTLAIARDKFHDEHVSTLLALHNLDLARKFADRILFVRNGSIVADLPADQVTPEVAECHLQT